MIQDYILTICSIVFSGSQINQIVFAYKNKRAGLNIYTAAIFASSVWLMAATYLSMDLIISGSFVALSACLWTVLLGQRVRYGA